MNNKGSTFLFILGIMATAVCLRGPITSVGSLVNFVENDLKITKSMFGFITTLPIIMFAGSSYFIPKIAEKMGHTVTLTLGMSLIAAGCFLRSVAGYPLMLAGTIFLGVGISTGNVLIPAMVKVHMPLKIGMATGIYLACQNLSATSGAAFSYPMADSPILGWRPVLGAWFVPGLLAILIWLLFLRTIKSDAMSIIADSNPSNVNVSQGCSFSEEAATSIIADANGSLRKSKIAWAITLIMGAQSVNYYCVTAWLPSILEATGLDYSSAGYLASTFQLFALPAVFVTPHLIANTKNKIIPATFAGVSMMAGGLLLIFSSHLWVLLVAMFILASGSGASFAWVIAIIAVVSRDGPEATRLSGMSQGIGYLMAALAPTFAGFLFDMSGSWISVMLMVLAVSALIIFLAIITGRTLKAACFRSR